MLKEEKKSNQECCSYQSYAIVLEYSESECLKRNLFLFYLTALNKCDWRSYQIFAIIHEHSESACLRKQLKKKSVIELVYKQNGVSVFINVMPSALTIGKML